MSEGICRVRKHEVNLATLLKLKTCTVSAEVKLTIFILLPSKLVHSYRKEFALGAEYFLDENTFWKVFICHGRKQEVLEIIQQAMFANKNQLSEDSDQPRHSTRLTRAFAMCLCA